MKRRRCTLGPILAPLAFLGTITAASAAGIVVSNDSPKQGETIEAVVTNVEGDGANIKFNGNEYKLFPGKKSDEYRALIGVPADLEPGTYKMSVGSDPITIQVRDGKFPLQHLRLPPGKDNFNMSPGEEEAVNAAKRTVSAQRHWNGTFVRPSKYRVSSVFGVKRSVNGHILKDYFHSGMDFAGPAGSPVVATSDGTVIFANSGWKVHGNCVAIDHGQGVVSFYLHLRTMAVKKGQHVNSGEQIGTIGQTGRANGPHLHFSIYVTNNATNPAPWFVKAF